MALYKIEENKLTPIPQTTFAQQNLGERTHLQALLKLRPGIVSPDTLIVAEEFGDWEDSRLRIDLLGIDKDANLVVIEIKRTTDGGHMELQAIRYAAMVSTMTFDKLVSCHAKFLKDNESDEDARENLLNFLDLDEIDDLALGQDIRIVLASAEFGKELTTSVLWLNERGLDFRCVRMRPYIDAGQVFLDVQTIIPIPEAEEYQVRIREKRQEERAAKRSNRDTSKYDLTVGNQRFSNLAKRRVMLRLVSELLIAGRPLRHIKDVLPTNRLLNFEGTLDSEQVAEILMKDDTGGTTPRYRHFFANDDELMHLDDTTYVLSKKWAQDTLPTVEALAERFPELNISCRQADPSNSD